MEEAAPKSGIAAEAGSAMGTLARLRRTSSLSTGLGLIAVWVLLAILSPHFLTTDNFHNILLQASTLAILAGGVTITLIAAEIDLSIGSVEALTGSLIAALIVRYGVPWPIALVAGLAAAMLVGLVNGVFTTRFSMPSFVTTLAMLGIAQGLAFVVTNGEAVYGLPKELTWIGQGKIGPVAVPIVLAAIVLAILWFLLNKTRFGLNVFAVGGNPEAARLSGIRVVRVKLLVLMLSAFTAGLAGVVLAARLGAGSGNVGEADLLNAIAAVVIGGTSLMGGVGTIVGTVIGVLLIASVRNGLVLLGISAFWQLVAIGGLILAAVLIDRLAKGAERG